MLNHDRPNYGSKKVVLNAFAQVLKELRKEQKLTQEDLASLIQSDRSFISQMERGLKQPSLYTLYKLSKALKVVPQSFIEKITSAILELS